MSTRILYGESAQLSVERIRFSNGKADKGGAMYFTGQSSVTINKGCLFADNVATTGGAIYMDTSSTLVIQGDGIIVHSALAVVFKNNKAANGAAIYINKSKMQSSNMVWYSNNAGSVSFSFESFYNVPCLMILTFFVCSLKIKL